MNPQQPPRFSLIGSLPVTGYDSSVHDNRRDVASQHGDIDFRVPLVPGIFLDFSSLTMQL
jgi:hypothetical protein